MIKRKGSQGLSLNMVVVGAIALVVLVVIVLIFNSSTSDVSNRYEEQGQQLMSLTACRQLVTKLNAYDGRVETYEDVSSAYERVSELQNELTAYADKIQKSCDYPAINFDGMSMTIKYSDPAGNGQIFLSVDSSGIGVINYPGGDVVTFNTVD